MVVASGFEEGTEPTGAKFARPMSAGRSDLQSNWQSDWRPTAFVPRTRTYLADLRGTTEAILSMQSRLETTLKGTAEFEVLAEPLPLQLPADPAAVLWWTQAPGEWSGRYVVPVVIEER